MVWNPAAIAATLAPMATSPSASIAVPFLLVFAAALAAQDAPAVADLAELLAPIREQHAMPALGAAVIVDGKLTALGATGIRRAGHDDKVTAEDLWHLGSCTKAMTATLCARFVEADKLKWTATVADGLPDVAEKMHADARAITVQHLLTHRAGLPGGPPRELWSRLWKWEGSMRDARTTTAAEMLAVAPNGVLGERFAYSNAGYMIAGAMLERVGNASWEELMQRELFAPLGIKSGGFGAPGDDQGASQPWGHRAGKEGPEALFSDNPKALGPAGTVHMTLRDWAKFALLHLGVPGSDGKPVLKAEMLQDLHALPLGGDYGLGWAVTKRPWAPGPILMHNGSNTMWFCVAGLAPEAKFGVLVTCNHGGGAKACDDVAAACARRFRSADK